MDFIADVSAGVWLDPFRNVPGRTDWYRVFLFSAGTRFSKRDPPLNFILLLLDKLLNTIAPLTSLPVP
jgi:hypothetical protein